MVSEHDGFTGPEIPAVCRHPYVRGGVGSVVSELTDYMATHEDQQEARMEQVRGEELSSP